MHVVAFHHITPQPQNQFDVTPSALEAFVRAVLDGGCRIVPPSNALRLVEDDRPDRSEDTVALIFDDGYHSTMAYALPLMSRYGVGFGMAPVPGAMRAAERPTYFAHDSTEFVTPEQLATWLDAGGELLGHSYSHVAMHALSTSTLEFELDRELAAYREFGLTPPTMFVYPFGATDDRVTRAVGKRYRLAFATGDGRPASPRYRFDIHRITYRTHKTEQLLRLEWAALER
ncbi:polysaccharide deacetylase family protein [Micromonosporaceae bacterium B7E4]